MIIIAPYHFKLKSSKLALTFNHTSFSNSLGPHFAFFPDPFCLKRKGSKDNDAKMLGTVYCIKCDHEEKKWEKVGHGDGYYANGDGIAKLVFQQKKLLGEHRK